MKNNGLHTHTHSLFENLDYLSLLLYYFLVFFGLIFDFFFFFSQSCYGLHLCIFFTFLKENAHFSLQEPHLSYLFAPSLSVVNAVLSPSTFLRSSTGSSTLSCCR